MSVMFMLTVVVLIALPACRAGSPSGSLGDAQSSVKPIEGDGANRSTYKAKDGPQVHSLADSLDPLREHLNSNKDRHRFVALLSPT